MSLHTVIRLYHNYYQCPIGFYAVNKIPQAEVMALLEHQQLERSTLHRAPVSPCQTVLYEILFQAVRLFCTLFFDCASHI